MSFASWRQWLRRSFVSRPRTIRRRPVHAKLELVRLEDRLAPAVWVGGNGGFWSDPLSWDTGNVPDTLVETAIFQGVNDVAVVDGAFTVGTIEFRNGSGSVELQFDPIAIGGSSLTVETILQDAGPAGPSASTAQNRIGTVVHSAVGGLNISIQDGSLAFAHGNNDFVGVVNVAAGAEIVGYDLGSTTALGGFSSTQGLNGWNYLDRSLADSSEQLMTFDSTNNRWVGRETFSLVAGGGTHPGTNFDAIRRWTAPFSGTIIVTGNVWDTDIVGGDPRAMIRHNNGPNLFDQAITNLNGFPGVAFSLLVPVNAGDTIDFIVNRGANGNNGNDSMGFQATITYGAVTLGNSTINLNGGKLTLRQDPLVNATRTTTTPYRPNVVVNTTGSSIDLHPSLVAGVLGQLTFPNPGGQQLTINGLGTNQRLIFTDTVSLNNSTINTVGSSLNVDWTGRVSGDTLTKTGNGTLGLWNQTNDYTGLTTINGGTLAVYANNALGAAGSGEGTIVNNGARLSFRGVFNYTTPEPVRLNAGSELNARGGSGSISGPRGTFSGPIDVFGNATVSTTAASGNVTGTNVDTTRFEILGGITLHGVQLTFTGPGGIGVSDAGAVGSAQPIVETAPGTIVQDGNGFVLLATANTYTGSTIINNGRIIIRHANGLGTTAAPTVVNSGGTLQMDSVLTGGALPENLILNGPGWQNLGALRFDATNTITGNILVGTGGASIVRANNNLTIDGSIQLDGVLTVNGGGTITVNGLITGSSGLTKLGTGTLRLNNGTNDYLGLTTVSGGVLAVTANGALGSIAAGTSVAGGASLQLENNVQYLLEPLSLAGDGTGSNTGALRAATGSNSTWAGPITLTASASLGAIGNGILSVTGSISDTGSPFILRKWGTGDVILAAANSYTGQTQIQAGNLQVNVNGALGTTAGNTVVAAGASLTLNNVNYALTEQVRINGSGVGGLGALRNLGNSTLAGTVLVLANSAIVLVNAGETLTLNGLVASDFQLTFSGPGNAVVNGQVSGVAPGNALIKMGTGTVTLNHANNDYQGQTTVYDGTLVVNGAIAAFAGASVTLGSLLPPAPAGYVAYYSFDLDTVSGTTVNNLGSLGATHNGVLTNGAAIAAGSGIIGDALSIPTGSVNAYMNINSVPLGANWTASAWFNTLYPSGAWRTLFRANSGGDHEVIVESSSQRLGMYDNQTGGAFRPVSPTFDMTAVASGWHHITAVGSGTTTAMYIDGVFVGTTDRKGGLDIFAVGNYQGGGQRFAQLIDEVYIYQRALTATEVVELYNAGPAAIATGNPTLAGSGTIQRPINVINGNLAPALGGAGTLNIGNLTSDPGNTGAYTVHLGPGGNDQINVTGTVDLTGMALNVVELAGFSPSVGQQFVILNNDGSDAITGTFDGLPNGATIITPNFFYRIQYNQGDGNDVVLTVLKGIIVNPVSGLVTTEAGGTAQFQVRLTHAPTDIVTVPIASSDPGEGLPNTTLLTFTPTNWTVPQTVTITGQDDFIPDLDQLYTIVVGSASSTDPDYSGLDPLDVSVTNLDDGLDNVVPMVKRVERIAGSLGSGSATVAIPNGPVNPSKTFILASQRTASTVTRDMLTFRLSADGSSVIIEKTGGILGVAYEIQVVEFWSGVRVQHGLNTIPDGSLSTTINLATAVNPGKTFALVTSRNSLNANNEDERWATMAEIINGGTELRLSRGEALTDNIVAWQVIEFTDQSTVVQSGTMTLANGVGLDIVSSPEFTNQAGNEFLFFTSRYVGNPGDDAEYFVRGRLNDTANPTTITFSRGRAVDQVDISWFVVSMPHTRVESNALSIVDGALTPATAPSFTALDLGRSISWTSAQYQNTSASDRLDDILTTNRLVDLGGGTSQLDVQRVSNAGQVDLTWFVTQFPLPLVSFETAGTVTTEGSTIFIPVSLHSPSSQTITVDFSVTDISTTSADYNVLTTSPLTFNPGETTKYIQVLILADGVGEPDEMFRVDLTGTNGFAVISSNNQFQVSIVNAPPIANNDSYVTNEDTPLGGTSVLTNDSYPTDANGDPVFIVPNGGPASPAPSYPLVIATSQGGSVSLNGDGTFTYTPPANFSGTDDFIYTISDGNAMDTASVFITVNAVNDPPENRYNGSPTGFPPAPPAGGSLSTTEYTPLVFNSASSRQLSIADVDALPAALLTVRLQTTNGTVSVGGDLVGITFTSGTNGSADFTMQGTLADLNEALSVVTFTSTPNVAPSFWDAVITMTTNDGGSSGGGGAQQDVDTITIRVTNVNDPPVPDNAQSLSVVEDSNGSNPSNQILGTTILLGDTDGGDGPGPLTIVSVSGTSAAGGTVTWDGTTATYTPPANFAGSDSFTYVLTDDGGTTTAVGTVNVTVTPVNDAPVNQFNGNPAFPGSPTPATTTDEYTPLGISGLSVVDVDFASPNVPAEQMTVTLTIPVGGGTLSVTPSGSVSVSGNGTASVQITGMLGEVNATLASLVFTPIVGSTGTFNLSMVSNDNGVNPPPNSTDSDTLPIQVNNVPDPPTSDLNGPAAGNDNTATFTEGGGPVSITDPGTTVTDPDSSFIDQAVVTITNLQDGAAEVLAVSPVAGVTVDTSTPGVLRITSNVSGTITKAQYAGMLSSLTYNNTSGSPSTVSRLITVVLTDDSNTTGPASNITVTIIAINSPPVNQYNGSPIGAGNPAGPLAGTEDQPLVFSSAFGNQLSIADPDAGTDIIQVILTATNGTVTVSGGGSATISNNGTAVVTVTGTLGQVNTAISVVTFNPTANYNGPASLRIDTDDQATAGTPLQDSDTINLTIAAVNDAPVANNTSATTPDNVPISFDLRTLASDLETADANLTFTIVSVSPLAGGSASIQPDGYTLVFNPTVGFSGAVQITYRATDRGDPDGSFANPSALFDDGIITVNVSTFSTPPTNITLSNSSVQENAPANTLVGILNTTDPDAGDQFTYTLVSNPGGAFKLVNNSGTWELQVNNPSYLDYELRRSITIRVQTRDLSGNLFEKNLVINLTNVYEPPLARADSYQTTMNFPLKIAARKGVLRNDFVDASRTPRVSLVRKPRNGTLQLRADGSFVYTPKLRFIGKDTFRYRISDGTNVSFATVTIVVRAPSASDGGRRLS